MHYESVKKKQAFNKRAKRAAKLGLPCNQYPFKMKRDGDLLKIASYYNDVVVPAAATRTKLMGIAGNNSYKNLQKNGFAFVPYMMNFQNIFMVHFKDRVSKKDYNVNHPLSRTTDIHVCCTDSGIIFHVEYVFSNLVSHSKHNL